MTLTFTGSNQSFNQPRRDVAAFPAAQLALLCLVRIAEPIALTSISPYTWKLVLHFHVGRPEDASFYAGILMCSFALAESLTGVAWGALSDHIGRRPVLLFGCAGTVLSLLTVGFSTSFWMALAGRALGGFLNGNIGVIQTMVGEMVKCPDHEPVAFALMPLMWVIGSAIGPLIGGLFAQPRDQFPSYISADSIFARYPFLLPNVICSGLLLIAICLGAALIQETLVKDGSNIDDKFNINNPNETSLLYCHSNESNNQADLRTESYGTFNHIEIRSQVENEAEEEKPRRQSTSLMSLLSGKVLMLMIALAIYTYHAMTYDYLLPIYMQDKREQNHFAGGLGFSLQRTGIVLGVNGLIGLVVQAAIFPVMCSWIGVWNVFLVVTIAHPIAYLIVPFLSLLSDGLVLPGLYIAMTIRSLFSVLAYPTLLILIKQACPRPDCLGKLNGLAQSVGAFARTIASPVGGLCYAVGISISFTPIAWWISAGIAMIGSLQLLFMTRPVTEPLEDDVVVHSLARQFSRESLKSNRTRAEELLITVQETIDEESEPESDEESELLSYSGSYNPNSYRRHGVVHFSQHQRRQQQQQQQQQVDDVDDDDNDNDQR